MGETDRFRLFLTGKTGPRVWCRNCGFMAWMDRPEDIKAFSAEDLAALELEMAKRKTAEDEEKKRALELIGKSVDHINYHNNLSAHPDALAYWLESGISEQTVNDRQLGYCPVCPTATYSASYTIPVMYRKKLFNIRHRLITPNGHGKYRPHMRDLPVMLYNADDLDHESIIGLVLEGEKKSIVVSQNTGISNVAIMGKAGFSHTWVEKFRLWEKVIVLLDPDADDRAEQIAGMFKNGYVVTLPSKADDFFLNGGTAEDFAYYLNWARRVNVAR